MKALSQKGLSLVELMVAVAIVAVVGGILARMLILGGTAWHSGDAHIQSTQEARKGMMSMARELRQSGLSTLTDMSGTSYSFNTNYASITFCTPDTVSGDTSYGSYGTAMSSAGVTNWSSPITYYVNNNRLTRLQNNNATILANNVTGLQFCLQNSSYVLNGKTCTVRTLLITLQTTKTTSENRQISMTLTSSVLLRD